MSAIGDQKLIYNSATSRPMSVRVVHDSPALQISEDDAGTPFITAVDGGWVMPNQNILLLDRHWQEMIKAGLVKNAPLVSCKTRTIVHDGKDVEIPTASYGPTSCGYDFRVTKDIKTVYPDDEEARWRWAGRRIDPKHTDSTPWTTLRSEIGKDGEYVTLDPNSFMLCVTEEWFHIPRNCVVQCTGKSTLARSGLIVTVTPWEPAWKGHVTIEVSNTSPIPVEFYIGEGVGQALMTVVGSYGPTISYADKGGKYQDQSANVTHSKY